MFCPCCKTVELVMAERQGVEIDYCPSCRGVWLDRGELDKIIERSMQNERGFVPVAQDARQAAQPYQHHRSEHGVHHDDHHRDEREHSSHGQRKSFWKELFD